MALDKQMILSELGSVVNKLQSADCGCMGKLFSNQGQYSNPGTQGGATTCSQQPTCGGSRHGYCQGYGYGSPSYGYSAPCAGEPYSANRPCMGNMSMQSNPPKLYADTYNYLSSNLMNPIVQEVYQDLKSINPANSVMNNPIASQMGLKQQGGGAAMPGNVDMTQNQKPGSGMGYQQMGNQQMAYQQMGNQQMAYQQMGKEQMGNQQMANNQMGSNQSNNQQMGNQQIGNQQIGNQQIGNQQMGNQQMGNQQMGNQQMARMNDGMGPDIAKMMLGDGKTGHFGQMSGAMPAGAPQSLVPGRMSPGQYTPEITNNAPNYGSQQVQSQYMQQQNMGNTTSPNYQNAKDGNMQPNTEHPSASYKVSYSNPAAQQMASNRGQSYGKHTPGVTKFNEMFPGVMGGAGGGDLDFDPMALAIQMNPANQQQTAISQMQHVMNGNPATTGANAAAAAINQPPSNQQHVPWSNQQPKPEQPVATQQNLQQGYTNVANKHYQSPQQVYGQVPQQQQLVYTALTGAPTSNLNQPPQQYQQQQYMDPNTQTMADPNLPTLYEGICTDSNVEPNQLPAQSCSSPPSQGVIKDPIYPAVTSTSQLPHHNMKRQRHFEYNTLGQPVEVLPATMYHQAPYPNTQQTLSPQSMTRLRNDQARFSVKNTVSKTSLMGSKPVGRTPSRGQLQQIYNQYKGSHSYTQQNIRPAQAPTLSERKINVTNQVRHVPVERVGGDTSANNQMANQQVLVKGQPMGHAGDVSMAVDNKPHGDIGRTKDDFKTGRNGLQDMVFTSSPLSAAWSFHGNDHRLPHTRYRLRA